MAKSQIKPQPNETSIGAILGREHGVLTDKHIQPNIFTLSQEINTYLETAKEQGFHDISKLNKALGTQIAELAYLREDKNILSLMNVIRTAPKGKGKFFNYGDTAEGLSIIRLVSDRIDKDEDERERIAMNRITRQLQIKEIQFRMNIGNLRNEREKILSSTKNSEGVVSRELGLVEYQKKLETLYSTARSQGLVRAVTTERGWDIQERLRQKVGRYITQDSTDGLELLKKVTGEGEDERRWGIAEILEYAIIEKRASIEPDFLTYLTKISADVVHIDDIQQYKDAKSLLHNQLISSMRKKLKLGLFGGLNVDDKVIAKVPPGYWRLLKESELNIFNKIREAYRKIYSDKNGVVNYHNFVEAQRKEFNLLLSVGAQDLLIPNDSRLKAEITDIQTTVVKAESDLNTLIEEHLNAQKDDVKLPKKTLDTPLKNVTEEKKTDPQVLLDQEKEKIISYINPHMTTPDYKAISVGGLITMFKTALDQHDAIDWDIATDDLDIEVLHWGTLSGKLFKRDSIITYLEKKVDGFGRGIEMSPQIAQEVELALVRLAESLQKLARMEQDIKNE